MGLDSIFYTAKEAGYFRNHREMNSFIVSWLRRNQQEEYEGGLTILPKELIKEYLNTTESFEEQRLFGKLLKKAKKRVIIYDGSW